MTRRTEEELGSYATALETFRLDSSVSVPWRARHIRLRLDTVVTVTPLVEEGVREGLRVAAQSVLEQANSVLVSLRTALTDAAIQQWLGADLASIRLQLRESEARRNFLLGRLLIRADPTFADMDLVAKVEANFNAARGINPNLDCRIDLELGEFLLAVAEAGKGDVRALYRRAVASLELASTRDAPSLRGDTIQEEARPGVHPDVLVVGAR